MKLDSTDSSSSVYESMSDLIMAVMVVMFMVIAVLALNVAEQTTKNKKKEVAKVEIKSVKIVKTIPVKHSVKTIKLVVEYSETHEMFYVKVGNSKLTYIALSNIMKNVNSAINFEVVTELKVKGIKEYCGYISELSSLAKMENKKHYILLDKYNVNTDTAYINEIKLSMRELKNIAKVLGLEIKG